jgi:two-component system sensor histidine kinase/response regulator
VTIKVQSMKAILIIEDYIPLRTNLVEALDMEGYQVYQTGDGLEGLELAIQQQPNLVITDLQLPGMDGDQIIQNLHNNASTAAIPVVLITAQSDLNLLQSRLTTPPGQILIKPFLIADLVKIVRQLIG